MWKSSVFNAHDSRYRKYTHESRAVLSLCIIRPRQGKKTPKQIHAVSTTEANLCTWWGAGRGKWRTGSSNQPCNFSSASHLCSSAKDTPFLLNHVKQEQQKHMQVFVLQNLLSKLKKLRLSNLIHLGYLCLNPWSKVFSQLCGDEGRQLCTGFPGHKCVGGGQRARREVELLSLMEFPPSPKGADQALLHASLQECNAGFACRSLQDNKQWLKGVLNHSHTKWPGEMEPVDENWIDWSLP